jgi:23S rRNA (guanosine2251-2'-O)-methyltransferase
MNRTSNYDIICGVNSVLEALRAGKRRVFSVSIAEERTNPAVSKIRELAAQKGVKVKDVTRQAIFELTRVETHQGVALEVEPYHYIDDVLELVGLAKKRGTPPFIVILDQINDPHNLGAIIRTACLLGADGIVIPKDNSASVTPTVAKSASGAIEYLPIVKTANLNNAINTLKNNNIWVVGAEGEALKTIYEYDFTTGVAIVLGGEGKGLRRLVKEHCDELLKIPMVGKLDSFNVSVAGAIFMSEVMRQRLGKNCAKRP